MLARLLSNDRRGERGQVLPLVAVAMVVLIGVTALTIDVGNAMLHKRRLQSAVDLAALSASQSLPDVTKAKADATSFTAENWKTRDSSDVATTVSTGCKATGCTSPDKVTIDASAEVSTGFARIFGINDIKVRAHAAACGPCDTSVHKFDVMVVLDRSGSMCQPQDSHGNCVDLDGAKNGIASLLKFFDPSTDRVGLSVLSSGDPTATAGHYPCESADKNSFMTTKGNWLIAPLSSDFRNPSSTLYSTIDPNVNCLKAKGNTPVAPAIQAATDELNQNGRRDANVTQVIVFLGDGGANIQPMNGSGTNWTFSWYHPAYGNPNDAKHIYPCRDAVARANIAKAAGIQIYTLGYDLNTTDPKQACDLDNQAGKNTNVDTQYDPVSMMQAIATDPGHFYRAATPDEITTVFNKIGHQITSGGSRLVE